MHARHLTIRHAIAHRGQSIFGTCLAIYRRSLQRQALRHLSDEMLDDIGISRAEAEAEAEKPFWRP